MVNRATWCAVRRDSSEHLHALAGRFLRQFTQSGYPTYGPPLTEGQERMWDQVLGELQWRSARRRRGYRRCACEFCFLEPADDVMAPVTSIHQAWATRPGGFDIEVDMT